MKKIELVLGDNLESIVYELLAAKARGESVYCEYEGHKLYSDTVSLDSAFLEVYNKTKEEYEREAKIQEYQERGKKIIFPERHNEWNIRVLRAFKSLYKGEEIGAALEIMEALEASATMEEVNVIFDKQNHSGASAALVRSIVFLFSKRGPEFYEATNYGEITEEERQILEDKRKENDELNNADLVNSKKVFTEKVSDWIERGKKIIFPERHQDWEKCVNIRINDIYEGFDIESALEIMEALEASATMEEAKVMFDKQNHSGSSAAIIISIIFSFSKRGPEFYEAINYGEISKEERETLEDKKKENEELEKINFEKWYENHRKEEKRKAIENIPQWIERGKKIIFQKKYELWEKCVAIRSKDLYNGQELESALQVMEILEEGATIEQAIKLFESHNHSGMSESIARSIILEFSKRGPEFYEATNYGEITEERRQILENKKKENETLKQESLNRNKKMS